MGKAAEPFLSGLNVLARRGDEADESAIRAATHQAVIAHVEFVKIFAGQPAAPLQEPVIDHQVGPHLFHQHTIYRQARSNIDDLFCENMPTACRQAALGGVDEAAGLFLGFVIGDP